MFELLAVRKQEAASTECGVKMNRSSKKTIEENWKGTSPSMYRSVFDHGTRNEKE
jgi:hypothetical protein